MQFLAIPVDIADAVLKRPGLSFFCAVLFFFLILGNEIQLVFFVKIGGNGRVIEGNMVSVVDLMERVMISQGRTLRLPSGT